MLTLTAPATVDGEVTKQDWRNVLETGVYGNPPKVRTMIYDAVMAAGPTTTTNAMVEGLLDQVDSDRILELACYGLVTLIHVTADELGVPCEP